MASKKYNPMQTALQRGREIRDAAEGDTIPGDPDHGRWGRVTSPTDPIARPIAPVPVTPQPFPLPLRPIAPITVAPDNLQQFNQVKGVPTRRIFSPSPISSN